MKDVHTVVVTHSHPDHFGGAGRHQEGGRRGSSSRTRRSPRGRCRRKGAHALRGRGRAARAGRRSTRPRTTTARRSTSCPTLDEDDHAALDEITDRDTSAVGAVGRHDAVGWQQAPDAAAHAPDDDPRDAAAVRAAGPDPARAARRRRSSSPAATGSRSTRPGHTLDHLCLYDPEHGVLLSGDHVLPVDHAARRRLGPGRRAATRTSRRSTSSASLDGVQLGLPAHGHPFDDVPGRVDAIKEHHYERMEKLRDASLAIGPAERRRAVARDVPRAALGRDGRERDVRPPRAPAPRPATPSAGTTTARLDVPGRAAASLTPSVAVGTSALPCPHGRRPHRRSHRPPPGPDPQRVRERRHARVGRGGPQRRPARRLPRVRRASTSRRFEPQPGRRSVLAKIEGSDPTAPTLMLMGHTDVVPVNVDGWSRDPFAGELDDGMVWGRGAVDMLNLTSTMAVAFRHLAESGFTPKGTLLVPRGRRRGGARHLGREVPRRARARRRARPTT